MGSFFFLGLDGMVYRVRLSCWVPVIYIGMSLQVDVVVSNGMHRDVCQDGF